MGDGAGSNSDGESGDGGGKEETGGRVWEGMTTSATSAEIAQQIADSNAGRSGIARLCVPINIGRLECACGLVWRNLTEHAGLSVRQQSFMWLLLYYPSLTGSMVPIVPFAATFQGACIPLHVPAKQWPSSSCGPRSYFMPES